MIQIRSGRNDPIDEAGFDQRNQRRHSQSRRSQRAGDRQAHGDGALEHLFGEELASLTQARRVVGEIGPVDQIRDGLLAIDPSRIDALALEKPTRLVRCVLYSALLSVLSGEFLLRLGSGCRCLPTPRRLEPAACSIAPAASVFALPASRFPLPVVPIPFCHRPDSSRFPRTDRRRFWPVICTRR